MCTILLLKAIIMLRTKINTLSGKHFIFFYHSSIIMLRLYFLLGSRTNGNNRSYVEFVKFVRIVTQHFVNYGGSETDTENGLR